MQDLKSLTISNFENKANMILGKAEVDKDGLGNFVELQDVTNFNIQSNITNIFQNTCAISFNISLLNTKDRYSFYDPGASCYDYIKEGRKIRLYLGISKGYPDIKSASIDALGNIQDGQIQIAGYNYYDINASVEGDSIYAPLPINSSINLGQSKAVSPYYYIRRGYLYFDTSMLPKGAIITKAVVKIRTYPGNVYSGRNFDIVIQNGQPDYPHEPLILSDFDRSKYSGNGGSINTSDMIFPSVGYTEIELNEVGRSWINAGGMTKFCIRSSDDINEYKIPEGDGYTYQVVVFIDSDNTSYPTYRPELYIEYTYQEGYYYEDYYWSWVYGIIDKPDTHYSEEGEMCNITGRDYIAYLSETYLKKLWWGKCKKYNVAADKKKYDMPGDCTGIYRTFLDKTGTRKDFKEITLNSEWTYDWTTNKLVFLIPSVPDFDGIGCLWVYYYTAQKVENLVADLLAEAGILNLSEKFLWLINSNLCTPTGKTVQRSWFSSGTNYITAINMLTETIIYRFYINGEGKPCFKRLPLLSTTIKRIDDTEYLIKKTEERLDELYNHFIIIGEKREMKRMCLAVIAYTAVYDLGMNSGELRGAIIDNGGSTLTVKGFKWQTGAEAEQDWHVHGSTIGYYTHIITGLIPDTEYKFCAYGENLAGDKKRSPWVYFRTLAEEE